MPLAFITKKMTFWA